jgi:subtilisin family serine protease
MPAHAAEHVARINPNIAYYEADQIARVVAPPSWAAKKPSNPAPAEPTVPDPQTIPWGITRVNGGGIDEPLGIAWVIDTGIDSDHPDLNFDKDRSRNFVSRGRPTIEDGNGHGTHVAGTIAASDNEFGVIGVAPGATVVAVRVLDNNGSGTIDGVIAGVDYVAANGKEGDVANMSLGGGFSQALNDAVIAASATVKFVLAAGNESTDANTRSPASASAEGDNIYTVSAMGEDDMGEDVWAYFSNYGNPPIDCAAPGMDIYSTYKDGGYATLSGTSMAAPHVAGVLLLGDLNSKDGGSVTDNRDLEPDTYPICVH